MRNFMSLTQKMKETKKAFNQSSRWNESSVDVLTLDELMRSNRELEQFAFSASHDLQEPLTVTSLYAQLLNKQYKGKLDPQADKIISSILDSTERMRKLIQGLLMYAQAGKNKGQFNPVDSHLILQQALGNLRIKIEESSAKISIGYCPMIEGNEIQLTQLFQNLIGNAIKFSKKETIPCIHISAREEQSQWCFSIQDNGIGIAPEHSQSIFASFKRLHTQQEYAGNGIGLALCTGIIECHEGEMWIESELGIGTTFYFTLPKRNVLSRLGE